jgi:diguanylate cyclase (GGDEF)-like protein
MAFERISLEQGLSQSSVMVVFQDSRGYMWLGTEDGLNRYDGFSFRTYKYDPADPASLPHNMVWSIVEDRSGDLFVGTEGGGVVRWSRETDSFLRLVDSFPQAADVSRKVRTLLMTRDGALWIGTKDAGLARLDTASGAVTHYRHDPAKVETLSHDGVHALATDRSGRLWVGTDGGLNRLDDAKGEFTRYLHDPSRPESLSDNRIRAIVQDGDGRLWIGTYGGLSLLEPNSDRFQRFQHDPRDTASLSHDRVRSLLEDAEGRLWVATDRGLDLMDRQPGRFSHYRNEPTDPSSLGDNNVMSLFQDPGGVIWVGTRSAGVHKWNPNTWSFGHRTAMASDPSGLREKKVTAFVEDEQGTIWIGTFGGGLHTLDRVTGEIRPYRRDGGALSRRLSDRVMSLAVDPDGMLWLGTIDGGLGRLDPATGGLKTYRHQPGNPGSLGADGVMSLAVDARGDLWVGTFRGGLHRFDRSRESFERFRHDPGDARSLGADIVTSILEDRSGALWLGTEGGGLNLFDRKSGEFLRFQHEPGNPTSLGSDTVFSLYQDPAGQLFVGTRGAGLAKLVERSSDSARFKHFTVRDGLPNDVVYAILPDGEGFLWLATNNGLARFDPRTDTSKNYDASDGLQSTEFNFGARLRAGDGQLFFGGVNGFNAFFPERLLTNDRVPPVVLTSFLKLNRPVEGVPLWNLSRLHLGYRDDVVTFEFAALDYAAPERNRYQYQLEGFDPDWVDLGGVRRVTYTDLGPGSYRFRVRAANNDGVWNQEGLQLPVSVEAPPWRRWWAYLGYLLGLGAGLLGFVRIQQRKLEREEDYSRRLEEEVHERTIQLGDRNRELEEMNRRLVEASLTDSLTGLRNRRFLFEHVAKDADLVRRRYLARKEGNENKNFDLTFMMIDLDHFKEVNDSCGHAAGDRVLRNVRQVLEQSCRNSDVLIRWGGDEFLLVGRDNDPEQVGALAERIRTQIESTSFEVGDGRLLRTTCSIGYACYPFVREEPELYSWEDVLRFADSALYNAKHARNAWVGFLSTEAPPPDLPRAARIDPNRLLKEGLLRAVSSNPDLERRGVVLDGAPNEDFSTRLPGVPQHSV